MKRKKQQRLLLVLVIVLVLAALAYFLLFRYNEEQEALSESESSEETIALYSDSFDTENIASFSFTTSDNETIQFEYDDDTWYYSSDKNFPADQSTISSISSTLLSMNAKRQVESSLDNSSDYGLDSPTRTVTVADTSGNQMTIYFGNSNDITGDYYVYTDTTDAVYTTESSNYEAFNYGLMDLVSIDSLPSIDSSLIKNITVDKTDGKWLMTYKESGDSDIDYTNQLTWFVTNPSKTESGMDASEASELTSDVSGISTSTCVAYNVKKKALKTYGLDNPQATITIKYQEEVETEASESDSTDESETEAETTTTYENKTFTFYIGDKYSDDYYYFTWDGTNQVCLLSSDTAEYLLGISNDTFLLTTPINITMSSVDKLVANNTTYTIDRTETTDEDGNDVTKTTYTKNGEDFDSSDFSSLFSQIKGITSEKPYTEKEETEEITGDTLTLTYTLNNNTKFKTVTFVFEPYDKDYYSLSVNGSKKWLINKIDVTNLMALF